jgi:hypothetical protein
MAGARHQVQDRPRHGSGQLLAPDRRDPLVVGTQQTVTGIVMSPYFGSISSVYRWSACAICR